MRTHFFSPSCCYSPSCSDFDRSRHAYGVAPCFHPDCIDLLFTGCSAPIEESPEPEYLYTYVLPMASVCLGDWVDQEDYDYEGDAFSPAIGHYAELEEV